MQNDVYNILNVKLKFKMKIKILMAFFLRFGEIFITIDRKNFVITNIVSQST